MTTKELTASIRKALKAELGMNSKMVSVRGGRGYNTTARLRIKQLPEGVSVAQVKDVAERHEEIHYCKGSGEMLSGINTLVLTSVEDAVYEAAGKDLAPALEATLAEAEAEGNPTNIGFIVEDTDFALFYVCEGCYSVSYGCTRAFRLNINPNLPMEHHAGRLAIHAADAEYKKANH